MTKTEKEKMKKTEAELARLKLRLEIILVNFALAPPRQKFLSTPKIQGAELFHVER